LSDDLADALDDRLTAGGELDAFRPLVLAVGLTREVPEVFHLAKEIVERLLAHPDAAGQLGWALAVGTGVLQDGQLSGHQVGEPALVQAVEHPLTDDLHGILSSAPISGGSMSSASIPHPSNLTSRPTLPNRPSPNSTTRS